MSNLRIAAQAALEAMRKVPAEYDGDEDLDVAIIGLEAALAEPQPEPVGDDIGKSLRYATHGAPVYAAPQAQQPLTDSEINRLMHTVPGFMGTHWIMKFARAIEAHHKIGAKP